MHSRRKQKYPKISIPSCPNQSCLGHLPGSNIAPTVRIGTFRRKWDRTYVQRYLCLICRKSYSDSTHERIYRQRKPFLNAPLFKWFASGGSQRRAALLFETTQTTVARKFAFLGNVATELNDVDRIQSKPSTSIQFDEMESIEHTKLKPLSIPIAVDTKTRKILGLEVCSMPAKGLLAHKSREKYGPRADHRDWALGKLFKKISPIVMPGAIIVSDSKPQYLSKVKKHFPKTSYVQVMSRKGSNTGQGELKKIGFDPIFSLNHTAAMIRANINRMFRKTWCTTKKPISLKYHLEIYAFFHNQVLIQA